MTKVAAVKVESFDYNYDDIEKGVKEAIELLGGIEKFISPGDRVLVKPNMLEAVKKELSVTTHS
ncbi:MAG: iron-sulfur cluster-binding protein [Firmicutes bacterium]|nr:iron-sulfur cluster-binding protein [Bacillota bacterium]